MAEFGSVEFRTLLAGTEVPTLTTSIILEKGQGILKPGAVLGKVTETGKYKLVNKASNDGSEKASVVLAEEVDTTESDVSATAFTAGLFNYDALCVADGDDVYSHQEELRQGNIYFKTDY